MSPERSCSGSINPGIGPACDHRHTAVLRSQGQKRDHNIRLNPNRGFEVRVVLRLRPPARRAGKTALQALVLACSGWVPVTQPSVAPLRAVFQTLALGLLTGEGARDSAFLGVRLTRRAGR